MARGCPVVTGSAAHPVGIGFGEPKPLREPQARSRGCFYTLTYWPRSVIWIAVTNGFKLSPVGGF